MYSHETTGPTEKRGYDDRLARAAAQSFISMPAAAATTKTYEQLDSNLTEHCAVVADINPFKGKINRLKGLQKALLGAVTHLIDMHTLRSILPQLQTGDYALEPDNLRDMDELYDPVNGRYAPPAGEVGRYTQVVASFWRNSLDAITNSIDSPGEARADAHFSQYGPLLNYYDKTRDAITTTLEEHDLHGLWPTGPQHRRVMAITTADTARFALRRWEEYKGPLPPERLAKETLAASSHLGWISTAPRSILARITSDFDQPAFKDRAADRPYDNPDIHSDFEINYGAIRDHSSSSPRFCPASGFYIPHVVHRDQIGSYRATVAEMCGTEALIDPGLPFRSASFALDVGGLVAAQTMWRA